jgi:plasmid stabilization system protein ParE
VTTIVWTNQAADDLAAIYAYIAQDSEHYALLTVRELIAAPERLAQFPESGRMVPELDRPEIREVLWRSYRVVYQFAPAADQVQILTVFRGERMFHPSVAPGSPPAR